VEIDEESFKESRPHLPTGSIVLDYLIGGRLNRFGVRPCPGLPKKCIINLYGQESSGKTTVALTAAAMVCATGGTVGYIDWENAIDVAYAKSLGIPLNDPDSFCLAQPESLEKGLAILWTMAKAGVDLIVIDSVGAGVPQASLEQKVVEKGEMGRIGLNAAKWSKILPELKNIINQTGSCVIGISQLRKKIGMTGYGGDDTQAQGGEAWKFYSEVRMGLKRIAQEKGNEYNALTHKVEEAMVGQTVKCRIDKCKVSAAQGKTADFYIRFGEGIDDLRSIVEVTKAHGVVKASGAWLSFERPNGTVLKEGSLDKFKAKVKEVDGVWDELYTAAIKAMSEKPGTFVQVIDNEEDFSDLDALLADPPAEVSATEED
jgi:recombination protein RecA